MGPRRQPASQSTVELTSSPRAQTEGSPSLSHTELAEQTRLSPAMEGEGSLLKQPPGESRAELKPLPRGRPGIWHPCPDGMGTAPLQVRAPCCGLGLSVSAWSLGRPSRTSTP